MYLYWIIYIHLHTDCPIGLVVRVFAIGAGGREFDPDRVKPKTLKMEPMTPSLSLSTMGRNREVLCGRLISCSEGSYTPKTASYHRNQSWALSPMSRLYPLVGCLGCSSSKGLLYLQPDFLQILKSSWITELSSIPCGSDIKYIPIDYRGIYSIMWKKTESDPDSLIYFFQS